MVDENSMPKFTSVAMGCISTFLLCGLGMLLGVAAVSAMEMVAPPRQIVLPPGQSYGSDESGSMGVILPSHNQITGAIFGGIIGLVVGLGLSTRRR